jgi:hypothetical protein
MRCLPRCATTAPGLSRAGRKSLSALGRKSRRTFAAPGNGTCTSVPSVLGIPPESQPAVSQSNLTAQLRCSYFMCRYESVVAGQKKAGTKAGSKKNANGHSSFSPRNRIPDDQIGASRASAREAFGLEAPALSRRNEPANSRRPSCESPASRLAERRSCSGQLRHQSSWVAILSQKL